MAKDALLRERDHIVYTITGEVCQVSEVYGLAANLLPSTGYTFVTNLKEGGVTNPRNLALHVVHEWIKRNPKTCSVETLCQAMSEIGREDAALKLEQLIQEPEGVAESVAPHLATQAEAGRTQPCSTLREVSSNDPHHCPTMTATTTALSSEVQSNSVHSNAAAPILVPLPTTCQQFAIYQPTGQIVSVVPQPSGTPSQVHVTSSQETDNHRQPVALSSQSCITPQHRQREFSANAQAVPDQSVVAPQQDLECNPEQRCPWQRQGKENHNSRGEESRQDSERLVAFVQAELEKLADTFDRCHGSKVSKQTSQSAREMLLHNPSQLVEFIEHVVVPIVGECASKLYQTACGLAIVRKVLKDSKDCHQEEKERLTKNGEIVTLDLLTGLIFQRDSCDTGKRIRDLPEKDQAKLKRLLADKDSEGCAVWRHFVKINNCREDYAPKDLNIDTFWHLIQKDYDVKKLCGHLIAAGLLATAISLEADLKCRQ